MTHCMEQVWPEQTVLKEIGRRGVWGESQGLTCRILISYGKKLGGLEKGTQVCMLGCDRMLIGNFSVVSIFD